jgi:hypothetical protein
MSTDLPQPLPLVGVRCCDLTSYRLASRTLARPSAAYYRGRELLTRGKPSCDTSIRTEEPFATGSCSPRLCLPLRPSPGRGTLRPRTWPGSRSSLSVMPRSRLQVPTYRRLGVRELPPMLATSIRSTAGPADHSHPTCSSPRRIRRRATDQS